MAIFHEYNREAAVSYARRWALGRNPAYMDYELWGGDCTNFISQCLRSGQIPMDYTGRMYYKNGIGIVIVVELQLGLQQSHFINM